MSLCGTKNVFFYDIAWRTFWSTFIFKSEEEKGGERREMGKGREDEEMDKGGEIGKG